MRGGKAAADPITVAKRERDAQLRELTDQAHGANSDLGHALVHNLATVDPTDMTVARFFVLCGRPHRASYADCVAMPMCRARGRREVGSRQGRSRSRSRLWRGASATAVGRDTCFAVVALPHARLPGGSRVSSAAGVSGSLT